MTVYDVYAFGEFHITNTGATGYKWNPGTLTWDAVTVLSDAGGPTGGNYQPLNGDTRRYPDLMLGPDGKAWLPGYQTNDDHWVYFDNSNPSIPYIRFGPNGGGGGPHGMFLHSVIEDPFLGAPNMYGGGLYGKVARWDGSSSSTTVYPTYYNGWHYETADPHPMSSVDDVPNYVQVQTGAGLSAGLAAGSTGYLFYHMGYIWSLGHQGTMRYGTSLAGQMQYVGVLMRSAAPGYQFDDPTDLTLTNQLRKIFTNAKSEYGTTHNTDTTYCDPLPPVAYGTGYMLGIFKSSYYRNSGSSTRITGDDLTFVYYLDNTGVVRDALALTWGGSEDSAGGLGTYYHEQTNTFYAFYASGTAVFPGSTRAARVHVMRLDSYTPPSTFAWTEVAHYDVPGTTQYLDQVFNITSDPGNLFLSFTRESSPFTNPHPLIRLHLADYSWTTFSTTDGASSYYLIRVPRTVAATRPGYAMIVG